MTTKYEQIRSTQVPEGVRSVMDMDSGSRLDGAPSPELVRESASAQDGAVPAWRDGAGVWQYVQPSRVDFVRRLGDEVRTVYVES